MEVSTAVTAEPAAEVQTRGGSSGFACVARLWSGEWPRWVTGIIVVSVYGAIALKANWPAFPGDPSDIRQGDLDAAVWGLEWIPYALLHGLNPLFSNWLNFPDGFNVAQNTAAPLLGLLTLPVTELANPLASLNLLLWLAFVSSGASMYFCLRPFTTWPLARFLGGALYAFSPYMVGQNNGHLLLSFVPLPPLILLVAHDLFIARAHSPRLDGLALGILVVAQFFIAPEVLGTAVLVYAFLFVGIAIARPRLVLGALRHAAVGIALAACITAVLLAYPIWYLMHGADHVPGLQLGAGLSADLAGTVIPTTLQRYAPNAAKSIGNTLVGGNVAENGSYLGIPLLGLLVLLVVSCWYRRGVRALTFAVLCALLLSLGPWLVVDRHYFIDVRLPMWWLSRLPQLGNLAEARISLYVVLFASAVVAIGLDGLHDRFRSERRVRILSVPVVALTVASVLSLVPSWPLPEGNADVPSFFTSPELARVPAGSVALLTPYPSVFRVEPQLWQAMAGLRFKVLGGYEIYPSTNGKGSPFASLLTPTDVEQFLWEQASGQWPYANAPATEANLARDLSVFLRRYGIQSVIDQTDNTHPTSTDGLFISVLGKPTVVTGGVDLWLDVPRILRMRIHRGP